MGTRTYEQPTHYQTLGVDSNAGSAQIREAYRALAKQLHPDVDQRPGAAERFRCILHAYEVLTDRESRRVYDAELNRTHDLIPDRTRPGVAHFSWQNIAATNREDVSSGSGRPCDNRRTDFDTLYETFFHPAVEAKRQGGQAGPEGND